MLGKARTGKKGTCNLYAALCKQKQGPLRLYGGGEIFGILSQMKVYSTLLLCRCSCLLRLVLIFCVHDIGSDSPWSLVSKQKGPAVKHVLCTVSYDWCSSTLDGKVIATLC